MIVAVPTFFAVIVPFCDTAATLLLLDDQIGVKPLEVVATMRVVCPGFKTREDLLSFTIGVLTVTRQDTVVPFALAVIVACPGLMPFTTPVELTVAILGLLDLQVICE